MLVLRIEDINGRGVYQYMDQAEKACRSYRERNFAAIDVNHPPPHVDVLLKNYWEDICTRLQHKNYRFGFRDKEQLLNWFPKEGLIQLEQVFRVNLFHNTTAHTMAVCVYEVPDCHVLIGDKQVAYLKHLAQKINSLSLTKFCERC